MSTSPTSAPRILIADELSSRAEQILREGGLEVDVKTGLKAPELIQIIGNYDGLGVRSATKVTKEVLDAASRMRIVGRAGIGVDNIDVPAASRKGVVVVNTPSGNATTTAEHAVALMMSLARRIPQATASMRAGKWEKKKFQGTELCDKTLGVVGLGNIGRIVADRAKGLHMRVIAFDPFVSEEGARKLGLELVTMDELAKQADIVTVHTPLTAETRGIVGQKFFSLCKRGVLVVNAARGGIVDEKALEGALESGQVAGAALDVFVEEPPKPDHPLLKHEQVICTPHLGASTEEAQEKVAIELAEQLVAFFARGEVRNAVNAPLLPGDMREKATPSLDLAKRLGTFLGQLVIGRGNVESVEVEIIGPVPQQVRRGIVASALAGILARHLDEPVNDISAPHIAADRGIAVTETHRQQSENWSNAVFLRLRGKGWIRSAAGTVFSLAQRNEPRLVMIDEFLVESSPEGRILVLRNEDRPGVIGAVGTLLGKHGINVSRMQVGLSQAGQGALQLWNIDGEISPELLTEIRRVPNVREAQLVSL